MSDATKPETAPETAPSETTGAPEPADLQTFISAEGKAADATVDVPAFKAAIDSIVESLPVLAQAQTKGENVRYLIAQALIAARKAVTYKGEPDYFGSSALYKRLVGTWLAALVIHAYPTMPVFNKETGETTDEPTDSKWIAKELRLVSVGYLGESATRAKGMLFEQALRDAVNGGKIPGGKLLPDGRITAPVLVRRKQDDGSFKLVQDVENVTAEDGTTVPLPMVATYAPGQAVDVPEFAKKVAREIVATAPKKKDGVTGKMVSTVNVPVRFGGPQPGTGGGKQEQPPATNEMFQESWNNIVTATGSLATDEMLQWVHAALTTLVKHANETGQNIEQAKLFSTMSNLLREEAKLKANHKDASLEKVESYYFIPEGETTKVAPAPATETADDAADDAAADDAATVQVAA